MDSAFGRTGLNPGRAIQNTTALQTAQPSTIVLWKGFQEGEEVCFPNLTSNSEWCRSMPRERLTQCAGGEAPIAGIGQAPYFDTDVHSVKHNYFTSKRRCLRSKERLAIKETRAGLGKAWISLDVTESVTRVNAFRNGSHRKRCDLGLTTCGTSSECWFFVFVLVFYFYGF